MTHLVKDLTVLFSQFSVPCPSSTRQHKAEDVTIRSLTKYQTCVSAQDRPPQQEFMLERREAQ